MVRLARFLIFRFVSLGTMTSRRPLRADRAIQLVIPSGIFLDLRDGFFPAG